MIHSMLEISEFATKSFIDLALDMLLSANITPVV